MEVTEETSCNARKARTMSLAHGLKHGEAAAATVDAELANRVRVFLAGLKVPGLRGVTIDVDGGVARVGGDVQTFHEKQLATHCCQRVAGVVHVVNNLRVAANPSVRRPAEDRQPA